MSEKKNLIIMIGLPRSGKSFFKENHCKDYASLSADDMREILSGGEKAYFKEEKKIWDSLYLSLECLCKNNTLNILVDNTSLTKKYRKRLYDIAIKYEYEIQYFLVDTPIEIVIERCNNENFPIKVIHNMIKSMDFVRNIDDEYNDVLFKTYVLNERAFFLGDKKHLIDYEYKMKKYLEEMIK